MPLNRALLGREYPGGRPYVVSRAAIRDFAHAINDLDPLYLDPDAAATAGYADVVAPPTFLVALGFRNDAPGPFEDPELGLDFSLVVHSEQAFTLHRPVVAGDELTLTARISQIKDVGPNELLGIDNEVHDATGAHIGGWFISVISRGTAEVRA